MKRVLRCSAAIALMIAVQAVPTYDSSRPAVPAAFDGTNGEDTFLSGPVSTETLPDGTVVQFGGMAIGGWTMDTPGTPGRTTAFAPVGPVPHIDPWVLAVSAEHEAPPPPVTVRANPDPWRGSRSFMVLGGGIRRVSSHAQ